LAKDKDVRQRAAGIEYEVTARPEGASAELDGRAGTSLQFLTIDTMDHYGMDAALWQPGGVQPAETTLVIQVHGSGSNYSKPPNRVIGARLAEAGRAVLAINTRQHDDRVATENFFDIRRDIDAAVEVGRALGYRRLVLQGHSLGTVQVLFYAATNWDPDIKAVSLLAPFGNLPWKTRTILVADEEKFAALSSAAAVLLRSGRAGDTLPMSMGWFTDNPMRVTAQHFLTYRWEETSAADSTFWIRRVPLPILVIRSDADGVIQPFEPHMLLSAASAPSSLVASVRYVPLRSSRQRSLDGHSFVGDEDALLSTITAWLDEHRL
jgi:pimeloyl-ACP methyl ester carboxylesterase